MLECAEAYALAAVSGAAFNLAVTLTAGFPACHGLKSVGRGEEVAFFWLGHLRAVCWINSVLQPAGLSFSGCSETWTGDGRSSPEAPKRA